MERIVDVAGRPCRVWEKGEGKPVFWLASSALLLRWTDFHEALSKSVRLVVCSLPGMPGSTGHDTLDDHLSWCLAARDLLVAAGFKPGDTLLGSSTVGALAAEVAAIWPDFVGRLVLIAPFGLYDAKDPPRDYFALHPARAAGLLTAHPERYAAQIKAPDDQHPVLWNIEVIRGNEATARFLWPLGDTRLKHRIGRITAPTLVVWGDGDQILPPSYADRFAKAIAGEGKVTRISGAGHYVELDQPAAAAKAITEFAA